MNAHVSNIWRLGIKELRSLWADRVLLLLIVWAFTGGIYSAAKGVSQELNHAPVAIIDQDHSPISARLSDALTPPFFNLPEQITLQKMDAAVESLRNWA